MKQRSQPARPTGSTRTGVSGRLARAPLLPAAALWLACAPAAPATDLYRWVDETGTTVYSQLPPPAPTPATRIKPHAGPQGTTGQQAVERLRGAVEQDFDQRDQQARDAAAASEKAAEQAARQRNCEAARKNLETLKTHGGGRLRTADGKSGFLSKDDLANQEEQARKQIEDHCR